MPERTSIRQITAPPSVYPARLADLKSDLGITGSDKDAELKAFLAAVGASVTGKSALGRDPWRQEVEESEMGGDGHWLYPTCWPIESITSIYCGDELLDTDTYEVRGPRRDHVYRIDDSWPTGDLKITYVAGWLPPEAYEEWQASKAHAVGDWVVASTPQLLAFECTTAGTSGVSEPSWPKVANKAFTDGTVQWTSREACPQPEDATQAALIAAKAMYRGDLDIPAGIVSESSEAGSVRYRANFGSLPRITQTVWGAYA